MELTEWIRAPATLVGLRVLGILLAAILLSALLRRAVGRVETRMAKQGEAKPGETERAAQRTRTLTRVLTSAGIVTIWVIAILTIIGSIPGIDIAPLLAGLGIGGLALGFGAQNLVKDIVSGFFLLLEDQYGIGDIVELNKAVSGTVETLTLRVTGLRDIDGSMHYISNGNITQVSNRSKDWSGVIVDVKVGYEQDLGRVREVLQGVGQDLNVDPTVGPLLLHPPAVLGVEALEDNEVVVRLSAQVKAGQQFEVGRVMRERIKAAFDAAHIDVTTS